MRMGTYMTPVRARKAHRSAGEAVKVVVISGSERGERGGKDIQSCQISHVRYNMSNTSVAGQRDGSAQRGGGETQADACQPLRLFVLSTAL